MNESAAGEYSRQLSLFPIEGVQHAERMHGLGSGYVVLCHKSESPAGRKVWKQKAIQAKALPDFLRYYYSETENVFVSQNRFFREARKAAFLGELDACWIDLDYYKDPALADMHPQAIVDDALFILEKERIPEPTLTISSGGGVYLVWLLEPTDLKSLPLWNDVQRHLVEVLKPLGSDPAAKPCTTVLRLPGTYNTKHKEPRRVEVLTDSPTVWDLEYFAREVLPDVPKKPAQVDSFNLAKAKKGTAFGKLGWNGATLWAGRYHDLLTLKSARWPDGIEAGYRDTFLFIAAVALSWVVEPRQIASEVKALARFCKGNWKDTDTAYAYQASVQRAIAAAKGEKLEYKGQQIDTRYRFKSSTIAGLLDVSTEEMEELGLRFVVNPERQRKLANQRLKVFRAKNTLEVHSCETGSETLYRGGASSVSDSSPWNALGVSRATYYRRKKDGNL